MTKIELRPMPEKTEDSYDEDYDLRRADALEDRLRLAVSLLRGIDCRAFHHPHGTYHGIGEPCPREAELARLLASLPPEMKR